MLQPDFNDNHPAWKVLALLIDRMPGILCAAAVVFAAYHAPAAVGGAAAVVLAKWRQ